MTCPGTSLASGGPGVSGFGLRFGSPLMLVLHERLGEDLTCNPSQPSSPLRVGLWTLTVNHSATSHRWVMEEVGPLVKEEAEVEELETHRSEVLQALEGALAGLGEAQASGRDEQVGIQSRIRGGPVCSSSHALSTSNFLLPAKDPGLLTLILTHPPLSRPPIARNAT